MSLLVQSGHPSLHRTCPLLGVKRTCRFALHLGAFDPKRTLNVRFCCDAQRGGRRRQIATAAIRSIGAVFSLTRAVKGHMNSPWTVRTTPAVSVHVRVAFRRAGI